MVLFGARGALQLMGYSVCVGFLLCSFNSEEWSCNLEQTLVLGVLGLSSLARHKAFVSGNPLSF
jgi:hypothetical protein